LTPTERGLVAWRGNRSARHHWSEGAAVQRIDRVIGLAAIAGAMAVPASAQAYNCHSWKCVNRTLNKMQKQVTLDTKAVGVLLNCIVEVPFTAYGDPNGSFGYAYNKNGTTKYTTALDVTFSGDSVGAWMLADSCNSKKTASIAHAQMGSSSAGLGASTLEMKFFPVALSR
jgi:hypothetical protein